MFVNNVLKNQYPIRNQYNQQNRINRINTNAILRNSGLTDKISFTGGAEILGKYYAALAKYSNVGNVDILYIKRFLSRPRAQIILFKNNVATPFLQALDSLEANIKAFKIKKPFWINLDLKAELFYHFREVISQSPELQNLRIKGILGQGKHNTAFLTEDNRVIKLSYDKPNFPDENHFIEGVDVPIHKRYIIQLKGGKKVYAVLEDFTEIAYVHYLHDPMAMENYNHDIAELRKKIEAKNHLYEILDIRARNLESMEQTGFIGDTLYLFDHGCIQGRRLAS